MNATWRKLRKKGQNLLTILLLLFKSERGSRGESAQEAKPFDPINISVGSACTVL